MAGLIVINSAGGGGTSLPSQSGQAGKYLTTNGTTASWQFAFTPNLTNGESITIPTNYTMYVPGFLQVSSGDTITLQGTAVLKVG